MEHELVMMVGPSYSYWVGYLERVGDIYRLHKATPISWWGTIDGMYELCKGPTKKTKIRATAPSIDGHVLSYRIVRLYPEGQKAWGKILADR